MGPVLPPPGADSHPRTRAFWRLAMHPAFTTARWCLGSALLLLACGLSVGADPGKEKEAPKKGFRGPASFADLFKRKPTAPAAPKSALLTVENWQKAPLTPLA